MHSIRIATRKSQLALWQAEHVATALRHVYPDIEIELVAMRTQGDKLLDAPLAKVGGKGLFIKELEQGILDDRADIAVHSMKDVPVEFPDGLALSVIMAREDPRDAFVSARYTHPEQLPTGARVGTCSLRRQAQLAARYQQIELLNLRGNVNTRLGKLDQGEFDAIILAAAGLIRLEMVERIACYLEPELCLPAIGQGAIGIECRSDDEQIQHLLSVLDDADTRTCVSAERALNERMQGSCQVPVAGYAQLHGDQLSLRGVVGMPDGSRIITGQISGSASEAQRLGYDLAEDMLGRGADAVLKAVYDLVN